MRRFLVTGSRHGWDQSDLIDWLLFGYWTLSADGDEVLLVHGDAPGVDTQAAEWWSSQGWPVEPFPALWREQGPAAGPIRNSEMVNAGADLCVAFGDGVGTSDCARKAEKAGIPVYRVSR